MKTYRFTERGVKHKLRGLDNQDASVVLSHGPHAFAFMADGMGSARCGDEAANIAVEAATDAVGRLFMPLDGVDNLSGKLVIRAAFPAAYNAIQRAAENEEDLNELLTTFMAVYYNERTRRLHFGYCGDGAVLVMLTDGSVKLLTAAQKGATHSQTTQLLDYGAWDFRAEGDVRAFMMLTDGLFDALCPNGALPEADPSRMKALRLLLESPLGMNDPRMRPYLDQAFSSDGDNDDLGALFECVGDDRSVVIVSADKRLCVGEPAEEDFAVNDVSPKPCTPSAPRAASVRVPSASSALRTPGISSSSDFLRPLSPDECEQVRFLIGAFRDSHQVRRFKKKAGVSHACAH